MRALIQESHREPSDAAKAAIKAKAEEAFPSEVADRLVAGPSPIRVFREYRGLTQAQLARTAGIARAYLAEIEGGRKQGSVPVLKRIPKAR